MALEELDGLDHHDWIIELAKSFGGYSTVLRDLTQLCMKDAALASDAETSVNWIRTKLNDANGSG